MKNQPTQFKKDSNIPLGVSLGALVVIGAVVGFGLYHIDDLAQQTEETLSQVAIEQQRQAQVESLRQTIEQSGGLTELLEQFFVGKDMVVRFIEELEAVAVSWNLETTIDGVNEGSDVAGRQTIEATLSVIGSYQSIINFLHELEAMPYHLTTSRVQLSRVAGTWRATVTVIGYTAN